MGTLSGALKRQLKLNEDKNLLSAHVETSLEIETTFLAALEELRSGAARIPDSRVEELTVEAASGLIDRIYAINQYIRVDAGARQALVKIYTQSWRDLVAARNVESTLRRRHYPRIRAWLGNLYPHTMREALASSPTIGRVPCDEYSADLQMRLMRLDLSTIKEPVMDIGCGREAHLVNFLRSRKIEAYGIDRRVGRKSKFLTEADWFDFPFTPDRWGTIVSNISFTNHLVYALKYETKEVGRYMEKYSQILNSLMVGGSFIYAPRVEILRARADERKFETELWMIAGHHGVTKIAKRP